MAQTDQLFLQLSEAFGGTRFGPFAATEVKLGSDPAPACDITLPAAMGVFPLHVRLVVQGDGSIIVGPGERGAAITIWRGGSKGRPISSPIALSHGDSFALVSETGPKFTLLLVEKERKKRGAPHKRRTKLPDKKGIIAEIRRQGIASALSSSMGQGLNSVYHFMASGSFLQPRYIVIGATMAGSWLMAGGAGMWAMDLENSLGSTEDELSNVKGKLAECNEFGDETPTIASLTAKILGDSEWRSTLNTDDQLMAAYRKKLKTAFSKKAQKTLRSLINPSEQQSQFKSIRKGLINKSIPDSLSTVLAYSTIAPRSAEWHKKTNSQGDDVCARGPMQLTYTQAHNLGLKSIQLDAYVRSNIATNDDIDAKRDALIETSELIGEFDPVFENDQVNSEGVGRQGNKQCLFVDGDDDRRNTNSLATSLYKTLGSNADRLPSEGEANWLVNRLFLFYAADFENDFDALDFDSDDSASIIMDSTGISDDQSEYVRLAVAETMANAVATPCLAVLDPSIEPPEHLGALPTDLSCVYLEYLSNH